jgi:hypothetical protein
VFSQSQLRHSKSGEGTIGGSSELSAASETPSLAQVYSFSQAVCLEKITNMATYILLSKFTDQSIRNVKETTKRAGAFRGTGTV